MPKKAQDVPIQALLRENRKFPPPKAFVKNALIKTPSVYAEARKGHGVKKGDRVTIYMPMVPELPIAMLACARIGAAHSVIFGGFSPEAVRERIHDADSSLVITADGGFRRGSTVPLKKNT